MVGKITIGRWGGGAFTPQCYCRDGTVEVLDYVGYSLLFKKFNFLKEHYLILCLIVKNVQIFKITLINLNSKEIIVLTS